MNTLTVQVDNMPMKAPEKSRKNPVELQIWQDLEPKSEAKSCDLIFWPQARAQDQRHEDKVISTRSSARRRGSKRANDRLERT